jgi:predicted HD phosphohydrolase
MSQTEQSERATFKAMVDGTAEDWSKIAAASIEFGQGLADRVLAHLRLLEGAERAGRSDEYVLCALLHDIGDTLGCFNHADVAAAIVKPFVEPDLHWMVEKHAEFQGYYFFHYLGLDRDKREQYRGMPQFDLTAEFCADFDQPSFDADYSTPPLEHYEPLVRQLMASPKRSIYRGSE